MREEPFQYLSPTKDHHHTINKWTPSTEICARDITSTTIVGRLK